jgi:aldose 1-epimerase
MTVTLGDAGLTVTLAMRNAGPVAIPAGLGWHPFLPVRGGVTLTSKFATVWPAIRDSIPAGPVALPGELDFAEGRELPSGLDTGFGGWDGEATVLWPNEGIGLAFTAGAPLGHVILYTPAGRDFFCLEPVTHAINAINSLAPDAPCGIRTLPRDGVFEASLTLRPFSAGTAAD